MSEDNLPWSHGQCDLDTERCYLPTEVVPINLLTFACFRTARLAGAGTSDGSSLRRMDSILRLLGLLTLQLLRFSPQRHHVPKMEPGSNATDSFLCIYIESMFIILYMYILLYEQMKIKIEG